MKITLCGSTRFKDTFDDFNAALTIHGHCVYSCGFFRGSTSDDPHALDEDTKRRLDLVHLEKISASDAIIVLNDINNDSMSDTYCLPYYGDSTRREIEWAQFHGKPIYVLNDTHELMARGAVSVWVLESLWDGRLLQFEPRVANYRRIPAAPAPPRSPGSSLIDADVPF